MLRSNEMPRATTLLVVSWYRLFAECLAVALRRIGQFAVDIADCDKSQICAHIETNPSSIILLRNDNQDDRCLDLITFLSRAFVDVKILILGDPVSERFAVYYLEAGAQGYIPGEVSLSDIRAAIQQVAKGEVVCSQSAAPAIFGRLANLCGENQHIHECESQILTLRENEILELMAAGLTNWQIGDRLSISAHTVKNHVHNILGKLHVNRRLLAVQEVYGRRRLNMGTATAERVIIDSPSKPKFPSSVRDNGLTNGPKNSDLEVVRGHFAGR